MSSSRSPGPSFPKRSRRIHNLDPVSDDDDDDAESVSDDNDSDPSVLQILSDSEPPTFAIEPPSYMNDESSFGDVDFATLVKNRKYYVDKTNLIPRTSFGDVDFATLVKDEKYYVDKTDLIPRILNLSEWAIAIFRHRNAMKTTHLKSIECYCDWKPIEGLDFEKLNVKTNDHFRKYCVLFIPVDQLDFREEISSSVNLITAFKQVILDSVVKYLRRHLSEKRAEIEPIMEEISKSSDSALFDSICFE